MLVAGTVVAVVFFWWVALGPLAWLIAGGTVRAISDAKDRAAALNTVRQSIIQ